MVLQISTLRLWLKKLLNKILSLYKSKGIAVGVNLAAIPFFI